MSSLYSSVGFTNPKLGLVSIGLTNNNYNIISGKINNISAASDTIDKIPTYNYGYTNDVRGAMLKINPSLSKNHWKFTDVEPNMNNSVNQYTNIKYENVFHPSATMLVNMNNYKFVYKDRIPVLDGYTYKNNTTIPQYRELKVSPSLFNPLFMVQYVGITPNTPLLNTSKSNNGAYNTIVDVSDCRIKTLVEESSKMESILGLSTYRYTDFMYCKDLGKLSNNHLITLRRFAHPIGDNIFEFTDSHAGDIGRLVTWFGTEDNKLEDILNFQYNASWKPLEAKIDPIESKEDSGNRGFIGMMMNSFANPAYNQLQSQGQTGRRNIFGFFNINNSYSSDNTEILRNYDNNKVYTPKNTIQDTMIYEGKLTFTHDFKLTFCYKLRAYDNINPRSAFLDLIGNIMVVTYRRGKFWGGDRKWIGPPQNVSGWQRVNSIINNTWDTGGSILSGLFNGSVKFSDIMGMLSNAASDIYGKIKNFASGGISGMFSAVSEYLKTSGLSSAALGELKNKLGRPALYAMDSLLKGDNVGLWHVTIGNPKNPIAVMGNLILSSAEFQQFGPLGLDDFPTELKITCNLKHARSRDAVEIGRMFTKGTNGIYYSYLAKGLPGKLPDKIKGTNKYKDDFDALVEEDLNHNYKTKSQQDRENNTTDDNSNNLYKIKSNNYSKYVKQFNQPDLTTLRIIQDEIS